MILFCDQKGQFGEFCCSQDMLIFFFPQVNSCIFTFLEPCPLCLTGWCVPASGACTVHPEICWCLHPRAVEPTERVLHLLHLEEKEGSEALWPHLLVILLKIQNILVRSPGQRSWWSLRIFSFHRAKITCNRWFEWQKDGRENSSCRLPEKGAVS